MQKNNPLFLSIGRKNTLKIVQKMPRYPLFLLCSADSSCFWISVSEGVAEGPVGAEETFVAVVVGALALVLVDGPDAVGVCCRCGEGAHAVGGVCVHPGLVVGRQSGSVEVGTTRPSQIVRMPSHKVEMGIVLVVHASPEHPKFRIDGRVKLRVTIRRRMGVPCCFVPTTFHLINMPSS